MYLNLIHIHKYKYIGRQLKKIPVSPFNKSALTIGAFDGMHCGHMNIIKELIARGEDNNLPTVVITFDPHPKSILYINHKDRWELLMCTDKKLEMFEKHGIDYVLVK